jgi:hypothetical protein
MGLPKDLELVGDNFTNAATALYIAYLIAEVPTGRSPHLSSSWNALISIFEGYILQMIPPGKWLGINVILWGIVTASIASISSYRGLLVTRILLGIFEAALSPCLMFIIGKSLTGSSFQILSFIMRRDVVHATGSCPSIWRLVLRTGCGADLRGSCFFRKFTLSKFVIDLDHITLYYRASSRLPGTPLQDGESCLSSWEL